MFNIPNDEQNFIVFILSLILFFLYYLVIIYADLGGFIYIPFFSFPRRFFYFLNFINDQH